VLNNRFISFEGIDGSGKTTQIEILKERLSSKGYKVIVLREPGGTLISEKIRKILLAKENSDLSNEAESLLFFASRNQLMREKIIPHLEEGCFVICDRFNDSTIAYQGYGFGMDISNLETISNFATINKEPDITFFLDISVSLSLNRRNNIENDRIESKGAQYLEKVRQGFLSISNSQPDRIVTIDASLNIDNIRDMIWSRIKEKYEI
tara:strand:- start:724 stop:1347 length:624 start_codon:yes stop_codon:yes gene_type:complete